MFSKINFNEVYKIILSSPVKTSKYKKANIKKVEIKDKVLFQLELFTATQAFHQNILESDISVELEKQMKEFSQCQIFDSKNIHGFRITSKGKVLSNKAKNTENTFVNVSHNKVKKYIINEGDYVPALIDLGVMTPECKVVKAHYDKFRQINKFLEIVETTLKNEDKKELNIIDFGCGKSYLTFILYHYLTNVKGIKANMIGLDLKEDVINKCNQIKDKYGYTNLKFEIGDISLYKPENNIDMIVTLHACDKATDFAMYHAIMLNSKYLLSVPCCQHEINSQMNKNTFKIMNKYGILKERFSALLTDSIRANLLEYMGYKVQVMEFVDFDSSPKNLLVKATYTGIKNEESKTLVEETLKEYKIEQTLYNLLFKK